jgi:hypothetical protein
MRAVKAHAGIGRGGRSGCAYGCAGGVGFVSPAQSPVWSSFMCEVCASAVSRGVTSASGVAWRLSLTCAVLRATTGGATPLSRGRGVKLVLLVGGEERRENREGGWPVAYDNMSCKASRARPLPRYAFSKTKLSVWLGIISPGIHARTTSDCIPERSLW